MLLTERSAPLEAMSARPAAQNASPPSGAERLGEVGETLAPPNLRVMSKRRSRPNTPPHLASPPLRRGEGSDEVSFTSGSRLRAVAGRNAFLLRVGEGGILVHLVEHGAVRPDPVGDELPVRAVPLLDAHVALALVIAAGELHRDHQALRTQLLDALVGDVEVLVAPLDFLALQWLLAGVLLRGADRLGVVNRIDHAPIVEHVADGLHVAVAAALAVDQFDDVLDHRIVRAGAVEGAGLVALGGVARGPHVLLRA